MHVVGIDFGTLSARAVVVSAEDGTVLGSASHDVPLGRDRARAAGHGRAAAAVVGASGPRRTGWTRSAAAVPAAVADAGVDSATIVGIGTDFTASTPLPGRRRTGRRSAGSHGSSIAPTPTRSSGSTTRPSRRPSASRRWRRRAASRGSRATAAASPPSGSSRRRFRCSRRIARSTRRPTAGSRPRTGSSGSSAAHETRNVVHRRVQGQFQDGSLPLGVLPPGARSRLRRLRPRLARMAALAARRARRRPHARSGTDARAPGGDRGLGRERRRARHRAGRVRRSSPGTCSP